MKTIQFQPRSTYKDVWAVITENYGKECRIVYEIKGFYSYGNEDVKEARIDEDFLYWLREYMGTENQYKKQNDAFVHMIDILA